MLGGNCSSSSADAADHLKDSLDFTAILNRQVFCHTEDGEDITINQDGWVLRGGGTIVLAYQLYSFDESENLTINMPFFDLNTDPHHARRKTELG